MEKPRVAIAAAAAAVALLAAAGASAAPQNSYTVTKLVSDQAGVAANQDTSLVNAWGLTARPTSPWWVSDNQTNVSTLYTADGTKASISPTVPEVQVPDATTGAVANAPGSTAFAVSSGTDSR